MLTEGFLRPVAVVALGGGVPADDDAVRGIADDGFVDEAQDGGQLRPGLLGLIRGDGVVGRRDDHAIRGAELDGPAEPVIRPVTAPVAILHRPRGAAAGQVSGHAPGLVPVVRVHELQVRPAEQFADGVTEGTFQGRVHPDETAVDPGDVHQVERKAEDKVQRPGRGWLRPGVVALGHVFTWILIHTP